MDINEILEYLEASKDDPEVKGAVGSLFDTDVVKSEFDRRVGKALATYREGHPTDEDAAARLAELEGEIVAAEERRETEAERADLRFKTFELATDRSLPFDLLERARLDSWEDTVAFADILGREIGNRDQEAREALLRTAGKPAAPPGSPPPPEPTAIEVKAMSHRERTKLIRRVGADRVAAIMADA